ncbi:MAG: glycosyltransferase [Thermomicrobiales bacterium]|nr:glycosyltransferase [Thermomicrobiales bacterium]MCO5219217.1 glycosyltransferase [Thermomicrobiales bacterium]MCO5225064.1 glycosyltransferase [Thermomicrobiales bacterium]MCO5228116.1 glycosyltransferase [Thermomicrobiales bacterium]
MTNPLIAVCVATYQRPIGLANLIHSLEKMEINGLNVHLVIADNDPQGSAERVVHTATPNLSFPVKFVVEPTRGLASVRNRLVSEALGIGAEFIAFVDDDETVDANWLARLFAEAIRSGAAAVVGQQIYTIDADLPRSYLPCFQPPTLHTGGKVASFGTNNSIIRSTCLAGIPGPFDVRLNLTGGEDSMISAKLRSQGHIFSSCAEAITWEHVPRSRANARWILKRAFRSGTTRSKISRWVNPSPSTTAIHVVESVGIIVKHGLLIIPDAILRRELLLFRLKCIVSGVGGIAGTITTRAYANQEYQTIHGS